MSYSDESGVTYTNISSPFEELSDIGSPRADDHEHLELPEMLEDPYVEFALQASPSPDYIPGLEEPEQAPPSPDYVSGPEHADDEIVIEDQPYAEDASPTAQSPEYVPESDLEAHPEDEDPEEDPVDYPADGGDDGDDEEGSSEDNEDDDMDIEADEEEEKEHQLLLILTYASLVCSEVVRLLAMSSPPASPLSPWSSSLPQIPFPPLTPILSPPSPAASTSHSPPLPPPFILSPTRSDAPSTGTPLLLPISASTSSPPLQLPSASHREDRPEVTLPPRVRQDIEEIYMRLNDEQSERQLLAGRLNMLFRDRRAHAYTRHLMETEVRLSREAWVRSTYASDLVHGEVMSLCTTILGQMTEIRELHAVDRRRQTVISEMLRADHRRFTEIIVLRTALQGQVTALQGQKQMATKRNTRSTTDQETINVTSVTNAQLQAMIDQGVTAALAARNALRSTNSDDSHNSGTGVRRTERATRECTYIDFLKCQPLPLKGTKGVASLSQWCERMDSVFHISNCAIENQVKFASCTLHSVALTWWNTYVKTVGHDAAYGLPDMIHGSVVASKPKTMQEAVEIATELMDKKIRTFAERETARKRKSTANTNYANNQRGTGLGQKTACYECGVQGHFKRECLKMKNNNNQGNQGGRNNAPARVYVVGRAGTDPDTNVVTGTFLLNNRYVSVLFDTGANKSFVSTTFSTQINIIPSTLDHCYDVELADGRIIGLNTILRGCTLNLLNHPFNINLMPVELGSFDEIIGMDWLAKYQAVIACAEKIVRIPWGNKTLIIHGDGSNQGNETRLSIISYTKIEKYVMKGFPIFLAHITTKEIED
nr:reverse transcriptase domain-containing protein [Tanacetum cinerariifolium]